MAEFERVGKERQEIAKNRISSTRAKLDKFKGGSPDEYLLLLRQVNVMFPQDLYPCKEERAIKIKSFLDLSQAPEINRVVTLIQDADRLLHFLSSSYGTESMTKNYILGRIWKLKKCKEVIDGGLSEVAILTQELVIIKQDLMKINEFDSFNEGHVTAILRKLPETKKNQFLDTIKEMEYKALKVSYGLGEDSEIPANLDLNPGLIPESEYRLPPEKMVQQFWLYIFWLAFSSARELSQTKKESSNGNGGKGKKFSFAQFNADGGDQNGGGGAAGGG